MQLSDLGGLIGYIWLWVKKKIPRENRFWSIFPDTKRFFLGYPVFLTDRDRMRTFARRSVKRSFIFLQVAQPLPKRKPGIKATVIFWTDRFFWVFASAQYLLTEWSLSQEASHELKLGGGALCTMEGQTQRPGGGGGVFGACVSGMLVDLLF